VCTIQSLAMMSITSEHFNDLALILWAPVRFFAIWVLPPVSMEHANTYFVKLLQGFSTFARRSAERHQGAGNVQGLRHKCSR
jgi:hypothetical protein